MHVRFSFVVALGATAMLSFARPALADLPRASDETVRISHEMLTRDTKVIPFRIEQAFKIVLASYKQQIEEIQSDPRLTPEQKKEMTDRTLAHAGEMLVLYDSVVRIAPVVFAATFHFFGIELPVPLSRRIPWLGNIGMVTGQGSVGLTFAGTEHQGSGGKSFSIGVSTLAGPTFTFGRPAVAGDKRPGASGVKMFMGVSLILPLRQGVPSTRMGDLQGWYMGLAGEGSIDLGSLAMAPKTVQIGGYVPASLDALLVFGFAATGAQDRPIAAQIEALNFTTLWGSDGSDPRSPIPYTANWSSSKHAPKNQLEELRKKMPSAEEMRDAIERANRNLENVR